MNTRTINDEGAIRLVEAIVDRTVTDFMVTTTGNDSRRNIEREILSDHFEALTGLKGSELLKKLNEKYDKKHRKGKVR